MGFSLPIEGAALTQPDAPPAPEGDGDEKVTAGLAVAILFRRQANEAETTQILELVSPSPEYELPQFPSVTFYDDEGRMIPASVLGATWSVNETFPPLRNLDIQFSNPKAKPLKKGEVLVISVVG